MELAGLIDGARIEARPYQERIVGKAVALLEGRYRNGAGELEPAARSVLVESPTGSGKTIMALLVARLLQERHGIRAGWVAMRRNLLAQADAENRRTGIGVEPLARVSMFEKDPPRALDLLIVDEAQHDATSSMAHLHNLIRPRWILGLTATPFRTDRIKLCFDKVLRDAGIHQLIQDGYLSEYDHFTIPDWSPETVAGFYLREPEKWGKSLVCFRTLAECDRFRSLLRDGGVACEAVTGSSDRERQIEEFHRGEIPVLVNCMVLTEGFDCPDLQTVFCRDASKGPTVQMGGRVFRRCPEVPVKQIVQSKRTGWPFPKVARPRQQWLWQEDHWRSLTVNPHINRVNARVRRAIAKTRVELPELVRRNSGETPWTEL